jgi:hypothetical protein
MILQVSTKKGWIEFHAVEAWVDTRTARKEKLKR